MQERGVEVDASTIFRWVQRYGLSSKSASAGIKATARAPGGWKKHM